MTEEKKNSLSGILSNYSRKRGVIGVAYECGKIDESDFKQRKMQLKDKAVAEIVGLVEEMKTPPPCLGVGVAIRNQTLDKVVAKLKGKLI